MILKYRIKYSVDDDPSPDVKVKEKTMTLYDAPHGITFIKPSPRNVESMGMRKPERSELLDLAKTYLTNEGINFYKIKAIALKKINDANIKNEYYVYSYRCPESYYSRPNLSV